MDVTPRELRDTDIREGFRGYHRDDVDELLERAAATIESLSDRVRQLTERLGQAETRAPSEPASETEDILKRTLVLAQKAADDAVAEAQTRSRQMLEESEAKSRRIVDEAEATARRIHESERARLEAEVADLGARREVLNTDVDALEKFEREYRTRLREAVEAELSSLGSFSTDMGSRPQQHNVVVPRPSGGATDLARGGSPGSSASSSATDAFLASGGPGASAAPTAPRPAPARAEPQPDARSQLRPAARPERRAEARPAEPRPAEARPARPEPAARPKAKPKDGRELANYVPDDGDDDNSDLDDDAFFATLREAVRDEGPLGPDEEDVDDGGFFDQDRDPDRDEEPKRRFRKKR